MKVQYASDLHIEFFVNKSYLKNKPILPVGDVLILAGDIVPLGLLDQHYDFFQYLSDHFANTYWIAGNHEYYQFNLIEKQGVFNEKITNNVHLINNTTIRINNIDFLFTTLWSHISPRNQWEIQNRMNDFHLIKYGNDLLSVEQYNMLHQKSLEFLKSALNVPKENAKVVVSHHVPSFKNYPERYKGDVLNEAFGVELFDLILSYCPDYWIYGHTHSNTEMFSIGKTKLLTNQLGYCRYNEHDSFDTQKHFIL
jgi:predicted phosphohydrolase